MKRELVHAVDPVGDPHRERRLQSNDTRCAVHSRVGQGEAPLEDLDSTSKQPGNSSTSTFARAFVALVALIGLLSLAGCSHHPGICIEDPGDCVGGVLEAVCPTDEDGVEWREYPAGEEDARSVCESLGYTNNIMGERYRRPRAD